MKKLNILKPIKLFDDTGRGDEFDVTKILYEDTKLIVVKATNEWYKGSIELVIYKKNNKVAGDDYCFTYYYAKN